MVGSDKSSRLEITVMKLIVHVDLYFVVLIQVCVVQVSEYDWK